jgi:hypothetical protein
VGQEAAEAADDARGADFARGFGRRGDFENVVSNTRSSTAATAD